MTLRLYVPDDESVNVIRCSPPSWMARIALEEKGAEYELVALDFEAGEHRSEAMLARNPRGTIPVLSDGERHVHETYAILQYVDAVVPGPPLMPRDDPARLAVALTRLHESAHLKDRGMALFAYVMRTPAGDIDDEHLAALGADFETELSRWETMLQDGGWLAGALSLADLSLFTYAATARQLGLELEARYPHVGAHFGQMRRRQAVIATWPRTWTEAPPEHALWR